MVEGDVAPPVTRDLSIQLIILSNSNLRPPFPPKQTCVVSSHFFFAMPEQSRQKREKQQQPIPANQAKPQSFVPFLVLFFQCKECLFTKKNVARAMHLSTTGFNAFVGFGNCPGGTWEGHDLEIIPVWCREEMRQQKISWNFYLGSMFLPFFCLFKKESDVFLMAKTGDLSTRTPSAIVPPVIASSERAFATRGSQGWARENDGRCRLNLP